MGERHRGGAGRTESGLPGVVASRNGGGPRAMKGLAQVGSNDELKEVRPRLAHLRSATASRKGLSENHSPAVTLTPGSESLFRAPPRCLGSFDLPDVTRLKEATHVFLGSLEDLAFGVHAIAVGDRSVLHLVLAHAAATLRAPLAFLTWNNDLISSRSVERFLENPVYGSISKRSVPR